MRKAVLGTILSLSCASMVSGQEAKSPGISGDVVKVGVITDLSGINLDYGGASAVVAAQMAADDVGGKVAGKPVVIVSMDHQNKPDVASQKVRQWFDQDGVDMVTEISPTTIALAVNKVASEKKRIAMVVGAATTRLTNEDCTPYTVHYAFDTYALSYGTASEINRLGGKSWYFLTADIAFGHDLEKMTSSMITAAGGKVLGASRHPAFQGIDFSSFVLSAQSSGADVVALANSASDMVNSVKMAHEFGLTPNQKLAVLLAQLSDIHGLTLPVAQGLTFTDAWYWGLNDETKAFAKRFNERAKRYPGTVQAGVYSATLQYLKAVDAAKTDDPDIVMSYLKKSKINDVFAKGGYIRADGRMVHDFYLAEVKSPKESTGPWDYYNIRSTIPAEKAVIPLEQSKCKLVEK